MVHFGVVKRPPGRIDRSLLKVTNQTLQAASAQ